MGFEVQRFEEEVIEASHKKPVVVDFWAPWCGPCRVLGPVIEKLAGEQSDLWDLVKVNSDDHPEISARFEIKGIPAVKMFVGGVVVDEFTGSLPEPAIRQWLEKALPSEAKNLLREAEQLWDAGDLAAAGELLDGVLENEPTNPTAAGLRAGLLAFSDPARALLLAQTAMTGEPRVVQIAEAVHTLSELLQKKDLDDSEEGSQDYAAAVEALKEDRIKDVFPLLIEVLKKNRFLHDDAARKLGVSVFTVLGPVHPVTRAFRRTFDMWLY
jgi:putative thioredoxin